MADFERNLARDEVCVARGVGHDARVQFAPNLQPRRFAIGTKGLVEVSFEGLFKRLERELAAKSNRKLSPMIAAVEAWAICQRAHEGDGPGRSVLERQYAAFVADERELMEVPEDAVDEMPHGTAQNGKLRRAIKDYPVGTRVVTMAATPYERSNYPIRFVGPAFYSTLAKPVLVGVRTAEERFILPSA